MWSENIEQRCITRSERIMVHLLHHFKDEDEEISEGAHTFDIFLSSLEDYFSTMHEEEVVLFADNGYRTQFSDTACQFIKQLSDDTRPENIASIVTSITSHEMESCITETVIEYFPELFTSDCYFSDEAILDNIFSDHCVPSADIIWEECRMCIFNLEISDLIDDAIIDSTTDTFVDIINIACEKALEMLNVNIPSVIHYTFQDILEEILELLNISIDLADPVWEDVVDEAIINLEPDAIQISKLIYVEIDYAITYAYIDAAIKLYNQHKNNLRDKEVNRITEEVRSMEI